MVQRIRPWSFISKESSHSKLLLCFPYSCYSRCGCTRVLDIVLLRFCGWLRGKRARDASCGLLCGVVERATIHGRRRDRKHRTRHTNLFHSLVCFVSICGSLIEQLFPLNVWYCNNQHHPSVFRKYSILQKYIQPTVQYRLLISCSCYNR